MEAAWQRPGAPRRCRTHGCWVCGFNILDPEWDRGSVWRQLRLCALEGREVTQGSTQ